MTEHLRNDLENYRNLIESVFGKGSCTFDVTRRTNHVTSALNSYGSRGFVVNFKQRLKRLAQYYSIEERARKRLLDKVNLIAAKNWDGAFAELAAIDYINTSLFTDKPPPSGPMILDKELDLSLSFSHELGKKSVELDGYFSDFDIYLDVKCLKDDTGEILDRIIEEVIYGLEPENKVQIRAEYPIDWNHGVFQDKRRQIRDELREALENGKPQYVKCQAVKRLAFRLKWGGGFLVTGSSYSPFRRAEEYHRLVFRHCNKFVKTRPFILVFVVFPWYNNLEREFSKDNEKFYRSTSRRVFCGYKWNVRPFSELYTSYKGEETVHGVSRYLSALLFLEDNTIGSENPDDVNITPYIYLNPNAKHKLSNSLFWSLAGPSGFCGFDDFEYDNY